MRRSWMWLGLLAYLWAGCGSGGGGTPSCPNATDISGLWDGVVIHDDVAQSSPGTISAAITQANCALGGTWQFTFAAPNLDRTLLIGGSAPEGTTVTMDLNECTSTLVGICRTVDPCTTVVNATLVSPTEMSGTYATGDRCSQSRSGSFDITLRSRLTPTPTAAPIVLPTATPAP